MSKSAQYRAKAVEHAKIAAQDVCAIHVRVAASYIALATKEMVRELDTGSLPLGTKTRGFRAGSSILDPPKRG
jgi:hypothetical protein